MAKIHGGVQAILKKKTKKMSICNASVDCLHNLWTQCSLAENALCVPFIGSFFAASTHQWDVLIDFTGVSVKKGYQQQTEVLIMLQMS